MKISHSELKEWGLSILVGCLVIMGAWYTSNKDHALVLGMMAYLYFMTFFQLNRIEKRCRDCGRTEQ